jgi:cation diffusion facilitator family transporter|tara:strand:+ start:7466 stop:8086 length:621 start_codon:yes stop_codon:yes gene_type:complete
MSTCCEDKACDISVLREKQSAVLKSVLAINAFMFFVEATAGLIASSTALLADSLDMLGDALVYGFSLYVLARDVKWQAISALLKGSIMAFFGAFVLAEAVYKVMNPVVPIAETIGIVGLLALLLNLLCLCLLWSHRSDDINMRSVWLCSRNDIIANVGVLVAATGVWYTHNFWPDIFVGLLIAVIFIRSAIHVIGSAVRQLLAANA